MKLTVKETKAKERIVALDDIDEGVFIGDTVSGTKVLVIRSGNTIVYKYANCPTQPWYNKYSGLIAVINPVEVTVDEIIVKNIYLHKDK
jgi:hypothetical protein